MNDKKKIGQADMMVLLDSLYNTAVNGLATGKAGKVAADGWVQPVERVASAALAKQSSLEVAAKGYINHQIAKCSTAGFLTGLGGLLTLPIAIPANIASTLFIQLQMIATLAKMGGYDVRDEAVRTMAYMCLADVSVDQALKQSGIQLGERMAMNAIARIPCEALRRINQRVGFTLVTKFGQRGVINLGKTVPLVGGVISGGFDAVKTKQIATRAYKTFIEQPAVTHNAPNRALNADPGFVDVSYTEV